MEGLRRLDFGTLDGIIGCVGAGVGVSLLPRAVVANAAAEGRIAFHRLPADQARVPTMMIRRCDTFVSTALARFIALARQHLASEGAAQYRDRSEHLRTGRRLRSSPVCRPSATPSSGLAVIDQGTRRSA